jgi:hypothetical protein
MYQESGGRRWRPTLVVLATVLALAGGLPLVDGHLDRVPDPRPPGDWVDVELEGQPASQATPMASLMPAEGWWSSGSGTAPSLRSRGSSLDLRLVPVGSDADCRDVRATAAVALGSELDLGPTGGERQVTTADGVTGTLTDYSGALVEGLVFAACTDGVALVASASGPVGARASSLGDVDDMLATVRFR